MNVLVLPLRPRREVRRGCKAGCDAPKVPYRAWTSVRPQGLDGHWVNNTDDDDEQQLSVVTPLTI